MGGPCSVMDAVGGKYVFRIWVGGGGVGDQGGEEGGGWILGRKGRAGRREGGFEWRGWLRDGVVEDGLSEGVSE